MAYLFLSFCEHLESNSSLKSEFYNLSLTKQFELLQKRLPLDKQTSSFRSFIETCFPTGLIKKYYISCPNFLREKHQSSNGKTTYLNNVVIRPELTLKMKSFLPDNQNIILIGDIYEGGKLKMFQVKGMQFIDQNMQSPNDIVASLIACNAFAKNEKFAHIWSVTNVEYNDTYFTPNKVKEIIDSCYTVNNPVQVRSIYEEWNKYINFRNYYLEEQSKRHFLLNSIECIDSYAINRRDYKVNASVYEEYLLNNDKEFSRSEMVILSEKVGNAESLPLIRLNIDRNRKAFESAKVLKRGKLINEEEMKIRSLSRDNVFITTKNPNEALPNGKIPSIGELLNVGYALGDRFKLTVSDILPIEHLEELDAEYAQRIVDVKDDINSKYKKIIADELKASVQAFEKEENNRINSLLVLKEDELNTSIDFDVNANSDNEIIKKIEQIEKAIRKDIRTKNKQEEDESKDDYQSRIAQLINEEISKIDVRAFYVERNKNVLKVYQNKLKAESEGKISSFTKQRQAELNNKYKNDILNEIRDAEHNLNEELAQAKKQVEEDETIKRFSLYFRINETTDALTQKQKETIFKCKYIVYDNRAETAKIRRQSLALDNFYSGYVKNPYLSTYLFNPDTLPEITTSNYENWTWYLESLNEKQKEAVRKAVASNGIFLLQGPPGTGKTQVIAETVAHLVKQGKKVLISSETHKAIDNVFERLPKIPEIVPIRLIPSNNKKKGNNDYDPSFLVDNFYENISSNLKKAIERYKNFKKNKEEFDERFNKLNLLRAKIEKNQSILDEANKEISLLDEQAKKLKQNNQNLQDDIETARIKLDNLKRTKRHIEKNSLRLDEDIDQTIILSLSKKLEELFKDKNEFLKIDDLGSFVNSIFRLNETKLKEELEQINPETVRTSLEIKRQQLRSKFHEMTDEFGDAKDEANKREVDAIKKELREIANQLNQNKTEYSFSDLSIAKIFNTNFLLQNLDSIRDLINEIKIEINDLKNESLLTLAEKTNEVKRHLDSLERKNFDINEQIKGINQKIIVIQDRSEITDIQESKNQLTNGINNFFKEFEISEPYLTEDEALNIIHDKWLELENDYSRKETENKEKIPVYTKIANYLESTEVIEADRKIYTKDLFENANVFGITCTSNDRFSNKNINSLGEFNIDDIDLKSVGIDVVIIDEVSKSSFIDLLIPILYGKTIILVGDHRQLPPMYEFSKLREDDFKGLDENIINPDINKKFTALYEECFFKTLFEKISDDYKTMLVKQYRCHEQIMDVFNHFYQGQLRIGFSGQNNLKQHNIKLISNGRNIIEPSKHIYFIDCKKTETHEQDSTSIYNSGEAQVTVELIKKINKYFKDNPSKEKLSIGVIATYGDQARKIKELLKSERVKTDAFNTSKEKMIVSTVDDFQGDERDIIILSMVRNPENPNKSNPGFILAYQRINVALSRSRRLLIVVGNRRYLESKGVIDLPDINGKGNDRHNFRVYEEIIGTIEQEGKVIDDTDVLEDKENKIYA